MIMFVIITLYPVLNTLAISLNDGTDALRGGIYLLPRKFTWKNYITVPQKDNLIMGAYITVAEPSSEQHLHCLPTRFWHLLSAENVSCLKTVIPVLGDHHVCQWWNDPDLPVI